MTPARLFLCAFAVGCVLSGAVLSATDSAVTVLIYVEATS